MDYSAETAVTAAVVARVKQLRVAARLSGVALADGMAKLGFRWTQATVAKLEAGRRRSISVDELLALALVLDVPPVWLLVDPASGTAVPIAEGVEVDPWTTLLWLIGYQALEGRGEDGWGSASSVLRHLMIFARLLEQYYLIQRAFDRPGIALAAGMIAGVVSVDDPSSVSAGDPTEVRRTLEAAEASLLRELSNHLGQFHILQDSYPPVPPDVRKRASELGIALPGQEG